MGRVCASRVHLRPHLAFICDLGCMFFSSFDPPLGSPSSPRSSPPRFSILAAAAAAAARVDAALEQVFAAVAAPAAPDIRVAAVEFVSALVAAKPISNAVMPSSSAFPPPPPPSSSPSSQPASPPSFSRRRYRSSCTPPTRCARCSTRRSRASGSGQRRSRRRDIPPPGRIAWYRAFNRNFVGLAESPRAASNSTRTAALA
jgi:hypothetical protein